MDMLGLGPGLPVDYQAPYECEAIPKPLSLRDQGRFSVW